MRNISKKFGIVIEFNDDLTITPSSLEIEKLPTFILTRLNLISERVYNPSNQVIVFNINWYENYRSPAVHYINIYEYRLAESFENFHWVSAAQYTKFLFLVNMLGINIISAMATALEISEEKLYEI